MFSSVSEAFDTIMGTAKQGHSAFKPSSQVDTKMTESTVNGPMSTRNDMLTRRDGEAKTLQLKYKELKTKLNELLIEGDRRDNVLKEIEAERDFLKKKLEDILANCIHPYAAQYRMVPQSWTYQDLDRIIRHLSHDALEATSLRAYVHDLQKEVHTLRKEVRVLQIDMLTKVEKIKAVSDNEFARDFRSITSIVKTLSREVRFANPEDSLDILASGSLLIGVSPTHLQNRADKKALTEAWFWSILIDKVFRSPFALLGERCDNLNEAWQNLFGLQHCNDWPRPTALSEIWRYTTMDQMLERTEQGVENPGHLRPQYKGLEKDIINIRNSILQTLQCGLSKDTSAKSLPKMMQLIDKAFALVLKTGLQRARFQVTYPKVGDNFHENTMALLRISDSDHMTGGTVTFIANPGLTKWGDAHGKNLDQRHDIVPSLVNVNVDSIPDASLR